MTKKEYLEILEGYETWSLDHEGCVGVANGQLWMNGECIDPKPTKKTLQALFQEHAEQEGF